MDEVNFNRENAGIVRFLQIHPSIARGKRPFNYRIVNLRRADLLQTTQDLPGFCKWHIKTGSKRKWKAVTLVIFADDPGNSAANNHNLK